MIHFFRKIRKVLADDNKPLKYMKYAIGEIFLVVMGILIALQVNDWNELRKERALEIKLYENLMVSLLADSSDVVMYSGLISAGMETQKFFLANSSQVLIENYTIKQLEDSIKAVGRIGASFFPRYSSYDQLSNNTLNVILQSEEIKTKLIELYDRRYKRYLHIDARIDEKSEIHLKPIINGDLQIFNEVVQVRSASVFDVEKFETHYPKLVREFSSILSTANNALDSLRNCQESIDELLALIRSELKTLKKRKW